MFEQTMPNVTIEQVLAVFTDFYPTQKRGYFARRKGGKLGCTISGALAIVGGMSDFSGSLTALLYRANRIGCDAHPAWFRYGAADGWEGLPINRQEPEGRDGNLWQLYEAGYTLGRVCAQRMGLPVPETPIVCRNRDDYLRWYQPAKMASS